MDASLLFRKKAALVEDGLDWLKGSTEFPYTAKRNPTGAATVSAILIRALLAALDHNILQGTATGPYICAQVASKSTPGAKVWCWHDQHHWYLPHADANKVTYHLGVLFMIEALAEPARALDFWEAYTPLLAAYQKHGKAPAIREPLVRAADELYYWGRYLDAAPDALADRFPPLTLVDAAKTHSPGGVSLEVQPLVDGDALRKLVTKARRAKPSQPPTASTSAALTVNGFVGWQVTALVEALHNGLNVLLAGPTGTGKTYAVEQAVLSGAASLVTIEGKEGLTDLDFLGAILPQPDGARRWVDGPLLRALRQAQHEPIVLFLDEINRIRREFLNLLLGLMNPKTAELCQRQGLTVTGSDHFYVIEVPMTSEIVWCPVAHLRFIGAGNFGGDYAVYPLDPAVRRRFDVALEFDYLALEQEQALLNARVAVKPNVNRALCLVAQYTRQMRRNGDLPGCIDTASLFNWARLCHAHRAETVTEVMRLGRWVWADLACGRDHLGFMREAKYEGLVDYLVTQAVLPAGELAVSSERPGSSK